MTKRVRIPKAKPGVLEARWGKPDQWNGPDLCYVNGGAGVGKPDARVLSEAFEGCKVFDGKNLRQELEARGYDITTLRFSIALASRTSGPASREKS